MTGAVPDPRTLAFLSGKADVSQEVLEEIFANHLTLVQRKILVLHYGLDGGEPMTFRLLGELVGWSPGKVSYYKASAMKRIYSALWDRTFLRRRVLFKMRGPHKEILILRDVQRKSYAEIARALAIPVGTVSSRLCRARNQYALIIGRLERGDLLDAERRQLERQERASRRYPGDTGDAV